jgi:release factor glutamine methyltransferase
LDARLLLQAATGVEAAFLIAEGKQRIRPEQNRLFTEYIARRATCEPVSRILGWREFYGRRFKVTPAVLDPRPDTETVIDACLQLLPVHKPIRFLDLGTGSGNLAVTLLAERERAVGVARDVSPEAISVAVRNAVALGVAERLSFETASWFEGLTSAFDLIVSNPPYIPSGDVPGLAADVKNFDPHLALTPGDSGLEAYALMAEQAGRYLAPGGLVVVEHGMGQHHHIKSLFSHGKFNFRGSWCDLGGHVRVLAFQQSS